MLLNWGANDMVGSLPAQATWQNNYLSIIDAAHAKWPNATIWVMYPWRQGQDANATTLHGWINNVVAARSAYTFVGPDEAVWLKGGDDGATNGTVHYTNPVGATAAAAAWKTTLGY